MIPASASGLLKRALAAELDLQSGRRFEDAALAFHFRQVRFPAAIRHVFAENDDVRVSRHLFVQRDIDLVQHGASFAAEVRLGLEFRPRGIDLIRIKILQRRTFGRWIGVQDTIGGLLDLLIHFMHHDLQPLPVQNAFRDQPLGESQQRIARFFGFPLGSGLIVALDRRKGNANKDASPWHAPAPDPSALARTRPPHSAPGTTH